ncbi:bifunctional oligoribonuclease and PAP phosphatase NrnA [Clostridium tepidiprofundi DSM 19306]|uniref:Cyclic-di-AMP phosphodiesterase n=1 Tax=Clostridium tepidiprofundi DSM 19306 TaxID=1121338 RepID=A0A151B2F1_9CLOT|nr:DHH family phosphoesterase [Clostridium tepidiprofundi]KYH34099.1 bifunctional oligoribonuclease and PAP phosphatase NrnA [Clostridium tepidiprofundi DSM 19306]
MENKYNFFGKSNKIYLFVIAGFILVLFYYRHYNIALTSLIVYAILIVYYLKDLREGKVKWKNFIENFSSKMDIATSNTLLNLPFSLLIIGKKGNILWYNQNFLSLMDGEEVIGKTIKDISREINVKYIVTGKKNVYNYVSIKDRYYDIYATMINTDDTSKDVIVLLYFYDVTEKYNLMQRIEENRESVVLVEVDNLDDVLKTTDEDKAPLLTAEIERNINSYAQDMEALVKKYAANKFLILAKDKFIKREMEKKFDILDTIRELDFGNKLTVTLSIGIGRGGESPQQNYKYASSAKELALGRGGDQAVVKTRDRLSFYGGKTKEIEKKTKVRARVIAHALLDLINESSNVVIMGHANPDIDCIGAAVGLYSTIMSLNKKCNIVLNNINKSIKNVVDNLVNEYEYKGAFIDNETCINIINNDTLLILVDVHNRSHVENLDIVDKVNKIVIIDHHRKAPDYIQDTLLAYIETYASSASELVTELIPYIIEKPKLKQIEAEALLAGICVDTKNFYFKTGVRTFEAAALLRKYGADTISVKKLFSEDLEVYIKRTEIIRTAEIFKNTAIAICPPHIEDNVLAAQVADELLNITGVQASFVFVKIKDEVFISGRSLGNINVQVILEKFGGGGHMTMAGAKVKNIEIEQIVEELKSIIEKYSREGE